MTKNIFKIYKSPWQIGAVVLTLAVPLVFMLLFSHIAKIATSKLFLDLFVSTWRLALAYLISVILAWIWAISFFRGRRAEIALPFFDVLQSFPTFAALPLAVLFLGSGSKTVVTFLVFTIIWPIFFSMISSLKLIRQDWEEAMKISGMRGLDYLRHFLLPVSVPGLVTGSIIGLGEGWEALVATEIITRTDNGLGSFFRAFSANATVTAVGILGLMLFIFSINKLIWFPLLGWSYRKMEE